MRLHDDLPALEVKKVPSKGTSKDVTNRDSGDDHLSWSLDVSPAPHPPHPPPKNRFALTTYRMYSFSREITAYTC